MVTRRRLAPVCVAAAIVCLGDRPLAIHRPTIAARVAPDFDIRDRQGVASDSARAAQAARDLRARRPKAVIRFDGRKGVRVIHAASTGLNDPDRGPAIDVARRFLASADGALLDLDPEDVETLRVKEETSSPSTKLRQVYFDQSVDGIPVFDSAVAVHLAADGRVVRLESSAAPSRDRLRGGIVGPDEAVRLAAGNVRAELDAFHPTVIARDTGPDQRTRMARGPLACEPVASLVYFPLDGQLRSAWHVVVQPEGVPQPYDIVVDARTGRILLRRNRCRTWTNPSSLLTHRETLIAIADR